MKASLDLNKVDSTPIREVERNLSDYCYKIFHLWGTILRAIWRAVLSFINDECCEFFRLDVRDGDNSV